jgi:hypothetical protein
MSNYSTANRIRTEEQWKRDLADARLRDAASDLAEAVRELLATHPAAYREPGKIDNRTDNAIRIARAALTKAEGCCQFHTSGGDNTLSCGGDIAKAEGTS